MQARLPRFVLPVLLAAALPATAALAQAPSAAQPQPKVEAQKQGQRARLSPDARARLLDGRMAMIKETLKLSADQLKLWAPVEQNLRASAAERDKRRAEWTERRQQGAAAAPSALPDRLDRATQRMSERAGRMKAFNDVFKPFYASLSDDQKAVAGVVLRGARDGRGFHHRRADNRTPAPQQ